VDFTDDQLEVLASAYLLRLTGRGFNPQPAYLPECEQLREAGYLARRMNARGHAVYTFTDEALVAQELSDLTRPGSQN
jgi:hypothetical protein